MGDPKKTRSKYDTPVHPWQKERLSKEKAMMKQHGLKNKKEFWKVNSRLEQFKDTAKDLVTMTGDQADKEREKLFKKLKSYGLLREETLDNVLGLQVEQLLNRRLQTLVDRKDMARSPNQARQMITHGHIKVDGKVVTSPSYLVPIKEESTIAFKDNSSYNDPDHPERYDPSEDQEDKTGGKDEIKSSEDRKEAEKDDEPEETEDDSEERESEDVSEDVEEETDDEKPFDKAPNSNNTKAEMKEYLDHYNVEYKSDMLKDEIYDLVKETKEQVDE